MDVAGGWAVDGGAAGRAVAGGVAGGWGAGVCCAAGLSTAVKMQKTIIAQTLVYRVIM